MISKLIDFFKEPLNILLAYIFIVGILNTRFIRLEGRWEDAILIGILLGISLLYLFNSKIKTVRALLSKFTSFPNIYITLYLLWGLVTVFFSLNKELTLLYVLGGFVVFFAGFVLVKEKYNPDFLRKLLYVISLVSLPAVLYSVIRLAIQSISPQLISTIALVNIEIAENITLHNIPFLSSYFSHPNTYGVTLFYSLAALSSLLFLENKKIFRIIIYILLMLYLPFIFFTLSRASLLAISIFTLLISAPAIKRKIYLLPTLAGIFVVSLTLFLINDWGLRVSSGFPRPFSQPNVATDSTSSSELDLDEIADNEELYQEKKISKRGSSNRDIIWSASVGFINDHPVTGAGFRNSEKAIGSYIPDLYSRYRGLTPHNTYLRTAVESGLVGLAIYLLVLANMFVLVLKNIRNLTTQEWSVLSIIAAVVIYQVFETNFLLGTTFRSFYFLVFLAIGFKFLSGNIERKIKR